MQPSEYKQQKALAIADLALNCVRQIAKLLPIAYPRKRARICVRPRPYARKERIKRKRKILHARAVLIITGPTAAAQAAIIMSKPIPKQ